MGCEDIGYCCICFEFYGENFILNWYFGKVLCLYIFVGSFFGKEMNC